MKQLANARWAACQPGTGHREMQIRACRELGGFEPDLRYASDDFLILVEMVRTTGACALLPDLVLGYGVPGVAIRTLTEGTLTREVFLLTRTPKSPAIEAVSAALHTTVPTTTEPPTSHCLQRPSALRNPTANLSHTDSQYEMVGESRQTNLSQRGKPTADPDHAPKGVRVAKPPPAPSEAQAHKMTKATRPALSADTSRLELSWAILGSNQ